MGGFEATRQHERRDWFSLSLEGQVGCATSQNQMPVTADRVIRAFFVAAISFGAATVGDSLLEGISNSGLLWHGHFTDKSSLDLVPMCVLAILALLVTLWLMVREQVTGPVRALMYSMSRALTARSIKRLLPAIVVLQFVTLFTMETTEQIVVYSHPLGGLLWLGAPAPIAMLVHAFIGVVSAFATASALTVSAKRLVRVIRNAINSLVTPHPRLSLTLSPRAIRVANHSLRFTRRSKRGPPTPAVCTI